MQRVLFFVLVMLAACGPVAAQLAQFQAIGQPQGQAGIGAVLITHNGAPVINQVIAHSPAANAGLKAQDMIVWVNYRDVAGMKLDEVVGLIRGPTGSNVAITVMRPGDAKPHTFNMTRAPIVIGL